jgi:hypothetical protein
MSSLKEIEERRDRMYRLIDQMTAQEDMTAMLQIVAQLEQEAKELDGAIRTFSAKMEKEWGPMRRPAFEVVLTTEQRARIMKETGVSMQTVWIEDQGGGLNAAMPSTHPEVIEAEALRQAKALQATEPAKAAAKKQITDALAEIEAAGPLQADVANQVRNSAWFAELNGYFEKKY